MEHKHTKQQHLLLNEADLPQLVPIPMAAKIIGIQYRNLLDATNNGTVPHYYLGKSRRLVSVPEVVSLMKNKETQL